MPEKNFSPQALDALAEQFDRMEGGTGVDPAARHYAMAEASLMALSNLSGSISAALTVPAVEPVTGIVTFEYRIKYDNPYLRNRNETAWTPSFPTVDAAIGHLQSWAVSNDYGEVLTIQRRRVTRGLWEDVSE